jgi:hypothetical protein
MVMLFLFYFGLEPKLKRRNERYFSNIRESRLHVEKPGVRIRFFSLVAVLLYILITIMIIALEKKSTL